VIWLLETRNHYNPTCTWGVWSTCTLTSDNKLRVDLFQKGRSITVMGYNPHETRVYSLEEILRRAAQSVPKRGVPLRSSGDKSQ
jgi:hypothetical protein